jgi:hypothetical protein
VLEKGFRISHEFRLGRERRQGFQDLIRVAKPYRPQLRDRLADPLG